MKSSVFLLIAIGTSILSAQPPKAETLRLPRARSSSTFQAIGVYWRQPAISEVRARASIDGETWTPWAQAHVEFREADRRGSELIYFGPGYRYYEVDGVPDPEVLLIDPGLSPARSKATPNSAAETAPLPIVSREQWGCTSQSCPAKDAPLYTVVSHLIVHHTAGSNTASDWSAVMRSIWVLHVRGNGWNDIGYNYVIDPNGALYEGRAGGDGVLGAHFSGVNGGTMGVALLGTYVDVQPPAPLVATLHRMLAWQALKWRLDPTAQSLHASSGLVLNVISGHRDAGISPKASGSTECPGNSTYSLLPEIRRTVLANIGACVIDIGERNRCAPAEGVLLPYTIATSSNSCAASPSVVSPVDWVSSNLQVQPNPGPRRSTSITVGNLEMKITQAGSGEAPLPCIARQGVVNSADFDSRPVALGSRVSIFGSNFASEAKVAINGKLQPVDYAGPNQINITLPTTLNIGTNHVSVSANGTTGPELNFWVTEAMPAIYIIVNANDFTLNTPETPLSAGRILTVYLTGVGSVDSSPLHNAALPWSATIGGFPARKLFLGAAPFLSAVYQANLELPAGLGPGAYPLSLTVNGVTSRERTISIAAP